MLLVTPKSLFKNKDHQRSIPSQDTSRCLPKAFYIHIINAQYTLHTYDAMLKRLIYRINLLKHIFCQNNMTVYIDVWTNTRHWTRTRGDINSISNTNLLRILIEKVVLLGSRKLSLCSGLLVLSTNKYISV